MFGTNGKAFIDTIKLITVQAETAMANIVRQILPPPSAATSQYEKPSGVS